MFNQNKSLIPILFDYPLNCTSESCRLNVLNSNNSINVCIEQVMSIGLHSCHVTVTQLFLFTTSL